VFDWQRIPEATEREATESGGKGGFGRHAATDLGGNGFGKQRIQEATEREATESGGKGGFGRHAATDLGGNGFGKQRIQEATEREATEAKGTKLEEWGREAEGSQTKAATTAAE
jgi:hypothetical protein